MKKIISLIGIIGRKIKPRGPKNKWDMEQRERYKEFLFFLSGEKVLLGKTGYFIFLRFPRSRNERGTILIPEDWV